MDLASPIRSRRESAIMGEPVGEEAHARVTESGATCASVVFETHFDLRIVIDPEGRSSTATSAPGTRISRNAIDALLHPRPQPDRGTLNRHLSVLPVRPSHGDILPQAPDLFAIDPDAQWSLNAYPNEPCADLDDR